MVVKGIQDAEFCFERINFALGLLYKLRELFAESPIAKSADFTARLRGVFPVFRQNFE